MTHIPVEVLNEIFIKLDLKDKLECMLVCRLWYNILDQCHLLDTLTISDRVFFNAKEMIKHQPHRATQVEYLKIEPTSNLGFDKRIIFNMFPNLRQVIFFQGTFESTNYLDNPFQFTHSTSKLKKITDFSECELTRQLARSNMCGNLKSLEMDLMVNKDSNNSRFFRDLKNMPVLEHLELKWVRLNLIDLEIMHSNLPSIKSLKFDNAIIASGELPRIVIPTSVTDIHLFFLSAGDIQSHIQFYNYMVMKYPSVIKPRLIDGAIDSLDVEHARHVYNEGFLPFYQKIGPRAEAITLMNYCNGLNAFEKFDAVGMKLKTLGLDVSCDDEDVFFIEELAQSKQAKYIQRLSVKDLVLTPIKKLLDLEALTRLRVACDYDYHDPIFFIRKTIDLNQLIAACPTTLIDLQVEGFELTFSETTSNRTCVESLYLENVDLTPDLVKVIETNFPKLSTLTIYSTLMDDVSISLPEHNLKLIKINTYYEEGRQNGFLIKTMDVNKIQYYSRDHSTKQVVPVFREEFDDPLVLNVTCASVENIELVISRI